ncbi:hypothetical protein ACFR9U_18000 [Halorientalis brevis]|uniref:Gins51 C-terminal domain-containing protein n=1 Tax=Halorientalis brevis TaxID=1126241 RepID=A0ABD6CHS5_9EURY|nr:hypothetical protein [Halorientalis brevis]
MNLDELQSIRDRERQSDSLQQLRDTFYADAGEFVQQLRDEREQAAARADDPFDAPEVNRLTDDIKTAEQTVEAIYERRVGKLVKMASFAAADMPTEDEGLTAEERELFDQLVAAIEQNRNQVFAILDGEDAESQTDVDPMDAIGTDPTPDAGESAPSDGVDAADLMSGTDASPAATEADPSTPASDSPSEPRGSDQRSPTAADAPGSDAGGDRPTPEAEAEAEAVTDAGQSESTAEAPSQVPPDEPPGQPTEPEVRANDADESGTAAGTPAQTDSSADEPDAERRSDGGAPTIDRTTVRITRDVGEIFGVDEREYDLSSEDVVTLPATNAEPLVERDAAERLE